MRPCLSKNAGRIDDSSEVNPRKEHSDKKEDHQESVEILRLQISSSPRGKDIAGVVNDDDDNSCCDLVGHHREDDQDDGNAVMQQKLVVFSVGFANDEGQFEQREEMDPQLDHEVDLHILGDGWIAGPIGVLTVNGLAFSTSASHLREPVLLSEKIVRPSCDAQVEPEIEAQFLKRFKAILPLICGLLLFLKHFAHGAMAKFEVGVLDDLDRNEDTYRPMNPIKHQISDLNQNTQIPFSMQMFRNSQNPFTQKASRERRIMLMVLKRVSEVISFLGASSS